MPVSGRKGGFVADEVGRGNLNAKCKITDENVKESVGTRLVSDCANKRTADYFDGSDFLSMICTASTNLILTKKLLEEVDKVEEKCFYSSCMTVAGAFSSSIERTIFAL